MKHALVTGSTSGIGLAIAQKLLEENCFVFINYAHNDERAKSAEKILREKSGNFKIINADMSTLSGVETLSDYIMQNSPGLDYTILNTYATDKTAFLEVSPEKWQHVMDTNVNMPFFLLQRLYNHLNPSGSVILIGSAMGIYPHAISTSYSVSKAALHMLCKCLVKELAPKQITINTIAPGFVETDMQVGKAPDHRQRIENKIALHRFAQPDEIACLCMGVLQNRYLNGAVIPICGGYDMGY